MTVAVNVINTARVERRRTSNNAVHFVALLKQQLSQIRSILTGDASDQCALSLSCGFGVCLSHCN